MAIILFVFWVIFLYKTLWCFVLPTLISACYFLMVSMQNLRDDNPRLTLDEEGIVIRGEPKISRYTIKNVHSEYRQRGLLFIVLEFVNGKEQSWQILTYIRKRLAEIGEARSTRQSTPLQFGKYHSDHQSTMADFAVAEWHPTDKDLDGE